MRIEVDKRGMSESKEEKEEEEEGWTAADGGVWAVVTTWRMRQWAGGGEQCQEDISRVCGGDSLYSGLLFPHSMMMMMMMMMMQPLKVITTLTLHWTVNQILFICSFML